MSLEEDGEVAGMKQAKAAANLQKTISLLYPCLEKLILSNPITSKKQESKRIDLSKSLQAIIDDWILSFPTGSKFPNSKKYFFRAIKIRNSVSHQSFNCNNYQHHMECLAMVGNTAIGKPTFADIIHKLIVVKEGEKEKPKKSITKKGKNETKVSEDAASLKKDEWNSLKEEGNHFYKQKNWREAMNCYTRAIHFNQEEAVLYSNRALCELHVSKFALAREDIEDAIHLDPKNVKYFRILSDVLLQMKMHQESLAACMDGLLINPRDEVLIIRERDCRALIASDLTDKNPMFGQSFLKASREEILDKFIEMTNHYSSLPIPSEDIEDCPNFEKIMERTRIYLSVAEAHQYEHEKLSATKGSRRKAFENFKTAAEKGSAEGLYNVARFYSEGKADFPRDFHKAIELCRKAASQKAFTRLDKMIVPNVGVAAAEYFLGNCYRDGRGVDKCSTEAFKWYLKSAQHDCPTAQNNLGLALLNGDGCKVDEASARSWFQKAVDHGLSEAQCNYAMVLQDGRGGPIDVIKAAEMLQLSADQGNAGACERLLLLSRSGALGASAMKKTKDNFTKAAIKGDPACLLLLGQNYLHGTGGFEKDLSRAEQYLREASNALCTEAHLPLGKLLLELNKNEEAFELIKLSAEKGFVEGQFELGLLDAHGHGCARDEGNARRWFKRAKQQGLLVKPNTLKREETYSNDWIEEEINYGKELIEYETQKQFKTRRDVHSREKTSFVIQQV